MVLGDKGGHRRRWPTVVALTLLGLVAAATTAAAAPALPAVSVDTTLVAPTGQTITVSAGGSVQAALNAAQPGDQIVLQAGAVFVGPFTLPLKSGSGWITIRTSAEASLPAPGSRVGPVNAPAMPKLVGPAGGPAIVASPGAHHFRFIGIEVRPAAGAFVYNLIELGEGSETTTGALPHHVVFDRCYIHGDATVGGRRGIALNGAHLAVIDSHLSDFKEVGADTQALAGWNGPGPFKIVNNHVEAAGENVMFGGADPRITNLIPSDIEVRLNDFAKPLAWKGSAWQVKNLFELKNAQRVLIEGNLFERNWPAAQNGFAILFTVRNQDGTAPWSVVRDVTFRHNVVRDVSSAINILGRDDSAPSGQGTRMLIANNLFENVGVTPWGGLGRLLQVLHGATEVTFTHNTSFHTGNVVTADGAASSGFVFTNNIGPHNEYGIVGTGTGTGLSTLATYFPGAVVSRNVLVGGSSSLYPAGNFFPATMDQVGFTDLAGGNYELLTSSPYHNAATDGTDIGVDMDALAAAVAGGGGGGEDPPPADTTKPVVSITWPPAGSTVSGTVTIKATASDNVGVVGVRFRIDGKSIGGEDTVSPYSRKWNTAGYAPGAHTIRAVARDAAGNEHGLTITVFVAGSSGSTATTSQAVVWQGAVNVAVSGSSLTKSGGCDGCADAGAVSSQQIASGAGWLEVTARVHPAERYVGLAPIESTQHAAGIRYAISLQDGWAGVYERGVWKADIPIVDGDLLRISLASTGVVTYRKNGTVFYTSTQAPVYPLRADAAIYGSAGPVTSAVIATSSP